MKTNNKSKAWQSCTACFSLNR